MTDEQFIRVLESCQLPESGFVAYVALIQERICERGNGGGWAAFARDNGELFQPGLLRQFYPQAQLESEMARKVFLLPRSTHR